MKMSRSHSSLRKGKDSAQPNSSTQVSGIPKEYQPKKRTRCGKCEACLAKPCGDCTPCKKKAEGIQYNKPCICRICPNLAYKKRKRAVATDQAKGPKVKRAKIIRDKSKPSNSALSSSASSSQGQVGASTPPSDVMVEEHEDEEDGQEDSATDVESSDKDEDDVTVLALVGGEVHYKRCLGEGSYGPVYSGVWYQGESSIPCAIKFPNCQPPDSLQASTRVKREAELVLTLIHPNIVQHLEVVHSDMPIFLMELMESNLTQYLQNAASGLPLHTQVNLCSDVAFGLAYLHSHSIVHGNLTSNNVLMKGERAKIADFVIGRLTGSQATATGPHMAPGVKKEGSDPQDTSDVYSYGLLMIQIITRNFPLPEYPHMSLSPPPTTSEKDVHFGTLTRQADSTSNSALLSVPSGHILESVVHSCLGDNLHRPTADTITKHLFSLSHHAEYQRSSSEAANNAQQEIEKLTLRLENMESMKTEVTTLHENFVAELRKAEEESKALQATLKEKEVKLKSCVSENKRLKDDVKMRKQTEKENQKLMRENTERIRALEMEDKKQKETIQDLNSQLRTKLEQSKNEMKAKLVSLIQQL